MKYWKEHEKKIKHALAQNKKKTDWDDLYFKHSEKIKLIQHERLIHLLVTLAFGFFSLLTFFSFLILNRIEILIPLIIFLITEIFYVFHYYRLENTTQKWYKLNDKLAEKIK
jgi:Ca2+/Na+ antiporter